MKLKKLRIVFENIDSYDIPLAVVKEFHVSGGRKDNRLFELWKPNC